MDPDTHPAPPEAEIIKLAREAAGMTIQAAAERSRALDPEGHGVSAVYWGNIERGTGGRRGRRVPARASAMKLALMAGTVGAEPGQLAGVGREDAARVLAEMRRKPPADRALPILRQIADEEELEPWIRQVRHQVTAAFEKYGLDAPGGLIFSGGRASEVEASVWDGAPLNGEEKIRLIATLRKWTAARGTGAPSRQTGLIRA
jgi:transcriptional regulator with XRE-family HTH domain